MLIKLTDRIFLRNLAFYFMMPKQLFLFLLFFGALLQGSAQHIIGGNDSLSYASPKEYTIGGVEITGVQTLDKNVIKFTAGLIEGQKIRIPGDATADAIKKLS